MPISDFEGDWTAYRLQFYSELRASFIDDMGDSTFPLDDASVDSAPDVSSFQALLWAFATGLAMAREQLERAGSNRNPATAQELLAKLEQEYQVVPTFGATISDRQTALSLRQRIAQGVSLAALPAALTEMLGTDFVSVDVNTTSGGALVWPASPNNVGVFTEDTAERKIFKILDEVSILNTPVTVGFFLLGDSTAPIAGEVYSFDPDPRARTEAVTILAVADDTITAVFTQAHDAGTVACRPHPVWISTQRFVRVVLKHAAAIDPVKRQRVDDYLTRAMRGVSQWCIASDAGSFLLGDATRGILGASSFTTPSTVTADVNHHVAGYAAATTVVTGRGNSSRANTSPALIAATTAVTGVSKKTARAVGTITVTTSASANSKATKRSMGAISATTTARANGAHTP